MATAPGEVPIPLQFKWVFIAVTVIFIAMFIGSCVLVNVNPINPNQQSLLDQMRDGWKLCLGVYLGLLGGRATDVKPSQH